MSTQQPEALWLADWLTRAVKQIDDEDDVVLIARWFVEDSAAELRRLHEVNAELLKACWAMSTSFHALEYMEPHMQLAAQMARKAIANAEVSHDSQ